MEIIGLTKLQIKINFGISALRWYYSNDRKKFLSSVALASVAMISLGLLFLLYLIILQGIYMITARLGHPDLVLAFGFMLSTMLVLFFGLTFVMSVLFFSRDLTLLVALPLRPGTIIGSKFVVIIIYEYLTVMPFFLPAVLVFGLNSSIHPFYWFKALIIFLLVPVLPLVVASLFVLVLMSITNLGKHGDKLRIAGMGFFMALIFLFSYLLTGIPAGEELVYIETILQQSEGLLKMMTRIYPPALFAVRALSSQGITALVNLGYFLVINLTGFALVLLTGHKLFYRGLIGSSEVSSSKNITENRLTGKIAAVSSPAWAIAKREIKYLLRIPVYLFNSLAILIIAPMFLIIPMISGNTMESYVEAINLEVSLLLQVSFLAGFIAVMALFAPAASSSFSREGRQFWISQLIPVSTREQIKGKLYYSYLVTALSIPIVLLISRLFLSLGTAELLVAIILGMLVSLPAITINLLIDLVRPFLNWDNPQTAIKQNMNVLFGMLAGGLIYASLFLVGWIAYLVTGTDRAVYLALAASATLTGSLFYLFLQKIAPGRYRDLEV